jgi:molybdopterin converting factor small subunit
MEIELRIRLYGSLADAIGREVTLEAPLPCSVGEVRRRLAARHAAAAGALERSRALIAGSFVADERELADADLVEFLPPVSGG